MEKQKLGAFWVALSAICFATIPVFARFAYEAGVNVVTLLTFRFLIGGVILLLITVIKSYPLMVPFKKMITLFGVCVIGYTLLSVCYFSSFKYIPASMAVLIAYIYPIIVWVIDCITGVETFNIRKLFSLCLALTGLVLILGFSLKGLNLKGVLLSLSAAVFFAVYIVGGNRLGRGIQPLVLSTFVTLGSGLIFLLYSLLTTSLTTGFGFNGWFYVFCLAIISTVVAILSFFTGLKHVGSTNAAIISVLEPVVTSLLSSIIFIERMSLTQYVGGALVLSGITTYFSHP